MAAPPENVISVVVGQDHIHQPDPRMALALAILVAVLVFAAFWAARKTFGLKH